MKKIKVKVGIDKSKLIKSDKRLVACGKNFWNKGNDERTTFEFAKSIYIYRCFYLCQYPTDKNFST